MQDGRKQPVGKIIFGMCASVIVTVYPLIQGRHLPMWSLNDRFRPSPSTSRSSRVRTSRSRTV